MIEGSFEWALEQLAKGYWVRADYWSDWGLYLFAKVVPGYRNPEGKSHIFLRTIEGESLTWRSRPYDETRAHWVLVTHADVCRLQQAPHPEFFWIRTGQPKPGED